MPTRKKTQDLARSLVAREAGDSALFPHTEPATVRAYERLRRQLGAPVGPEAFQALASRALALARSESSRLSDVQVAANGSLLGLAEVEALSDAEADEDAGILLIAQLLGLFLNLLGEATTMRLIQDLRLQADPAPAPEPTIDDSAALAEQELLRSAAFRDILLQIDRLRAISNDLETIAEKYPGMEDGLVSVAGNIRGIATVLDVFTLIRSRAGGPPEEAINLQTSLLVN